MAAMALVPADDGSLMGRLRIVARSIRAGQEVALDAAWQGVTEALPAWLTLDPTHFELVADWALSATYAEAASVAGDHASELLDGPTELALDDVRLHLGRPTATTEERAILATARLEGFDAAYRPFFQRGLIAAFLGSTPDEQGRLLTERRDDLLDVPADVVASVADPEVASDRSGENLLVLARRGLDQRALASMASPGELARLAGELVHTEGADGLLALAKLGAVLASTPEALATALFHASVSSAMTGDVESGADMLRDARRTHQEAVNALIPSLLAWTAARPELAALAPVLAEPLAADAEPGD